MQRLREYREMSKSFEEELQDRIRSYEEHRRAGLYTDVDMLGMKTLIEAIELYLDHVSMEKKNGCH